MSVFIIAEIGLNHNGNIDIAKNLIDVAVFAGCDAVKFQKRTIHKVYSQEELAQPYTSPFGTTFSDYKHAIEFSESEYDEINDYCHIKNIPWFASAWDLDSLDFLSKYNLQYNKVASPMIKIMPLINEIAKQRKYTFISTGMGNRYDIWETRNCFLSIGCSYELMHCNSSYPMDHIDAHLNRIRILRDYFHCNVGYSSHERGLQISMAAVALGATSIERHITLDRTTWGSDQAASLEPLGLIRLVKAIRIVENAFKPARPTSKEVLAKQKRLANPYWWKIYNE